MGHSPAKVEGGAGKNLRAMPYDSLDSLLESGIASICDGDWSAAQTSLGQRLEETVRLGRRRLNLFLLSLVAGRVGLSDVAEQLSEDARRTPLEMGEPRYLGTSEDPVRRELEREWWSFNGWRTESEPEPVPQSSGDDELHWASVLDGALEGRAGEMERRWSRFLDGDRPERPLLWNLLALGYLESGDLRTYEEMRDQATTASTEERDVPQELAELLTRAGLHAALADLRQGRWLTSESLHDTLTPQTSSPEPGGVSPGPGWEAGMEESFSLLSVGRAVEAARKLGGLSLQGLPLHRAYALNALGLALFSAGDYADAQEALADCRREAAQTRPEDEPELAARYAEWLLSAGARPVQGDVFCDPFAEPLTSWDEAQTSPEEERADGFWPIFEQVLEGMRLGDHSASQLALRRLLGESSSKERTKAFLISLLSAGIALLEGDHMEAQESIEDASRLLSQGGLQAAPLVEAQGRLAAAGALTLAGKMELEALSTLDPWRDFPADFQQQSYSGL